MIKITGHRTWFGLLTSYFHDISLRLSRLFGSLRHVFRRAPLYFRLGCLVLAHSNRALSNNVATRKAFSPGLLRVLLLARSVRHFLIKTSRKLCRSPSSRENLALEKPGTRGEQGGGDFFKENHVDRAEVSSFTHLLETFLETCSSLVHGTKEATRNWKLRDNRNHPGAIPSRRRRIFVRVPSSTLLCSTNYNPTVESRDGVAPLSHLRVPADYGTRSST